MKKVKFNIAMIAIVLGISAAFAFKPKEAKANPTKHFWYAVQDAPNHYIWQTSPPANYTCQDGVATCEISVQTTGTPTPNQLPSTYVPEGGPDQQSVYKP
jgi:hypothetical protein